MPETPAVTYTDLAWIAEAADGMQTEPALVLAKVQENGGPPTLRVAKAGAVPVENVLANIQSKPLVDGRVKATGLQIQLEGSSTWIDCRTPEGLWADAVFCTESAMQKFVINYYHDQRLLTPAQWDRIDQCLRNKSLAAILHVAPSHS